MLNTTNTLSIDKPWDKRTDKEILKDVKKWLDAIEQWDRDQFEYKHYIGFTPDRSAIQVISAI